MSTKEIYSNKKAILFIIVSLFILGTVGFIYSKSNKNIKGNNLSYAASDDTKIIPSIVAKVSPSVVGVSTTSIISNDGRNGIDVQEGIGSGFIINAEGDVLTNYHVVKGASQVKVILNNGTEVNAKVLNYDPLQDLAVVKIIDSIPIPTVASLGNSDNLKIGETVIAIGNPLGKEFIGTVTSGIVSAIRDNVDVGGKSLNLIQTDAAINPGNSGGPLLDAAGMVIGINTAKIGGEGIEGIGFSIPINSVKNRLATLSAPMPVIGISGSDITADISKKKGFPTGVYVNQVNEGSTAKIADIKVGDVIIEMGNTAVKTIEDINSIKSNYKSGDTINVKLVRSGTTIQKSVKLS